MLKREGFCPLGSKCEDTEDGKIKVCNWYVQVAGKTPDGEDVDEWRCSMSWLPTLLVENAMTNRGQTQALNSLRNETITRQDAMNNILLEASRLSNENKRKEIE